MQIRTILVDDEINSRNALKQLLSRYCKEIEVIGEAKNVAEAFTMIQQLKPSLIFLDIEMPNGTGFDLLMKFPNPNFDVIFVTGFDQYALNAFKFSATDYLLKPLETQELIAAVNKVIEKQKKSSPSFSSYNVLMHNLSQQDKKNRRICIQTASEVEIIRLGDILYCEASGNYTVYHLINSKQIASSERLGELESRFSEYPFFFRSHDSYLINIEYVVKYNKTTQLVLMENTVNLPISRRRKDEFLSLLQENFSL